MSFVRFMMMVSMAITVVATAADADDSVERLLEENAELRERVDRLSEEMRQLKALFAEQGVPPKDASAPTAAKPVRSKSFDVTLYGMIKADMSRDDSRTSAGNFARWVESEGILEEDDQFSLTANQTRLGILVEGPSLEGLRTSGQVEIDFYGAGAGENRPEPMLRHAFVKVDWEEWNLKLLAGQTWDIISPLHAPTVNYSVLWWQGNIGYRRPQLRLTQALRVTDDVALNLEAGVTRTITDRRFTFTSTTDPDSGGDAGVPTIQGRVSVSFPSFNQQPATVGLSGHWGQEDQHQTNTVGMMVGHSRFDTWSACVDLRVPVTDWLLWQAEGFLGENLNAYLGGIGQGFDTPKQGTIGALGGWTAVTLGPWAKWQFNLGAGIDTVDRDDVTPNAAAPPRLSNTVYFGNGIYSLTANLQLALELMYMRTSYLQAAAGDNWRQQFAVIYKF